MKTETWPLSHNNKLKPEEIATIFAVYEACNRSIHAHQPIQRIQVKMRRDLKKGIKKWVEKVARKPEQYIQKHKDKTYSITKNGITILRNYSIIE